MSQATVYGMAYCLPNARGGVGSIIGDESGHEAGGGPIGDTVSRAISVHDGMFQQSVFSSGILPVRWTSSVLKIAKI